MSFSRADAKAHIDSIRKDRGLPDDNIIDPKNRNLADLVGALTVTSDQLYSNHFHFIWEIIQNTDDAEYADQTPQLRIVVTDDALHAWSNQTGFRQADVDSICGIGNSSKSSNADTIGEKGIGFKSLFCVADIVTIHSDPYHFKFDTTTPIGKLGMITPTWVEELPEVLGQGLLPQHGTLVSLRFKPNTDVKSLRQNLERLDFSFLIFCRRLKKIQLSYNGSLPEFLKLGELRSRTEDCVTLWTKQSKYVQPKTSTFRLFEKELTNMPQQAERAQQKSSIIQLAFLLPRDWTKGLVSQMTYAFMPMKAFGFNFMIHANFILTANRGEVIQNHQWNKFLRSEIVNLVHQAIMWFATSLESPAKFHWPHYLSSLRSVHDSFFKPLALQILDRLRSEHILLTDSDDEKFYQSPINALLISDEFKDNGKLILNGHAMLRKSINGNYAKTAIAKEALATLGVEELDHLAFLCEFEWMVLNETEAFRSRPPSWHASVATILLASRQRFYKEFYSKCKRLEIVPLTSGRWAAPDAANVFLPGENVNDVPPVLTVQLVDPTACIDTSRSLLFDLFGIKACTNRQLCEAIIEDHRNDERDPAADPIAEFKFLFLSNYIPKATDQFDIFCEESEYDHPGDNDIHIQFGEIGSKIRQQFGSASTHLTWLHEDYASIANQVNVEVFVTWLRTWPGMRLWPEVSRDHQLTPVMEELLKAQGPIVLLDHFRFRVKHGVSLPVADEAWKQKICNLEVPTNQGTKKLCETALPNIAKISGGIVPGLEVPETDNQDWSFLCEFGVVAAMDARFPLQKLRHLKSLEHIAPIDDKVEQLYFELGKLANDEAMIKEAFAFEDLVYLGNERWVDLKVCRWKAEYRCTAYSVLSDKYPQCKALFKGILQLKTADLDDLLKEFNTETVKRAKPNFDDESWGINYQLLLDMNKLLRKPATHRQVTEMKKLRMFPVTSSNTDHSADSRRMMKSTDHFWIGDIPWVQRRFVGKVALLLPVVGPSISDLDTVFITLGMLQKRLTRSVHDEIVLEGTVGSADMRLEQWLQPKLPYLTGLLQHAEETKVNRGELVAQLQNIKIQRVSGIKIRRFVQHGPQKIYATDEEGEICIKASSDKLTIHIHPKLGEPEIFDSLAEQLTKYWNLQHKNAQLLYKILISSSPDRFMEVLERAGIVVSVTDEVYPSYSEDLRNGNTDAMSSSHNDYQVPPDPRAILGSKSSDPACTDSHSDSIISSEWTDKSRNVCPTDETSTQYQSSPARTWRSNYRPTTSMSYGDIEMDDVFSSDRYHYRTRSTASDRWNNDLQVPNSSQYHQDYSLSSSPSKRRRYEAETYPEEVMHEIGRAGEVLVYNFLSQTLKSFSLLNWTSGNRRYLFPDQPFTGEEWQFSDFTYEDAAGEFRKYLRTNVSGYEAAAVSGKVTYHLEVKTTLDGISASAKLSNNQIEMARQFSRRNHPQGAIQRKDEYILVRVYDLKGDDTSNAKIRFYPDPWDLICQGRLAIEGDEYLHVRPR